MRDDQVVELAAVLAGDGRHHVRQQPGRQHGDG
jgi:hypothetical protein